MEKINLDTILPYEVKVSPLNLKPILYGVISLVCVLYLTHAVVTMKHKNPVPRYQKYVPYMCSEGNTTILDGPYVEKSHYTERVRWLLHNLNVEWYRSDRTLLLPLKSAGNRYHIVAGKKYSQCSISGVIPIIEQNLGFYLYDSERYFQKNVNLTKSKFKKPIGWHMALNAKNLIKRLPYGFNMLAFVRDPLSRFATVYKEKCLRNEEDSEEFTTKNASVKCLNCEGTDLKCVLSQIKYLLSIIPEHEDHINADVTAFAPQSWNCNMRHFLKLAHFVKINEGDKWQQTVVDLVETLKSFGFSKEEQQFIHNELIKYTPNKPTETEKNVMDSILNDESLYADFMYLYVNDFKGFDFRLPKNPTERN